MKRGRTFLAPPNFLEKVLRKDINDILDKYDDTDPNELKKGIVTEIFKIPFEEIGHETKDTVRHKGIFGTLFLAYLEVMKREDEKAKKS